MANYSNNYLYAGIVALPPQMIPLSEKTDDWKHACLDTLEQVGRNQYYNNVKLTENYEMIKGRFIFKHYFEDDGYADMINQLTREFEIPNSLRHYDIISQVVNTMVGEWESRPDNFKVKSYGERHDNDFLRAKTDMLLNYVQSTINAEINNKLLQQGIDPNKTDFNSKEEQQQYIQFVEQQKQALTPPQIEEYMATKWMQAAEIWAQHQLEYDKQRFNFPEKEKREFEDMLVADRCFRHFYLKGNTYEQETWNPINTFFHKSPETEYIEDGDYVGRVYYLTIPAIIDRYGWLMKESDINILKNDINGKWKDKDGYGIINGSVIPYEGFGQHKVMMDAAGINPMTSTGIATVGEDFFKNLHNNNYYIDTRGTLQVTEGYWRSHKRIGKVTYIDADGVLTKTLVDETFVKPKDFKEIDSSMYEDNQPNTVSWTWVNEIWQGVKINTKNTQLSDHEDIYLNIRPCEFQFKGDINIYNAKLPVCGQVFSIRNSASMSLVDLMKPYQIGFNVAVNQLYQIQEREVGRFFVMDTNMLLGLKDWGGERGWEKFMLAAKNLGMAPVDTSPQNMKGAAQGGFLPKEIDLDETTRMASRMKIAEFFETMALKQVGFNDYRLGNFASTSTSSGVESGKNSSYSQTESYFTNFSNYLRRCYTMNLDIAQYVQSQKEDITISYIKSDMSRAYIKVQGTDLLNNDIGLYVSNSREQVRQLEMLRQLGLENNTSGATIVDLAEIVTSNSPQQIKMQLKESFDKQQQRVERQLQVEEEKLKQTTELKQFEEQEKDLRLDKELDAKKEIAYIQTFGRQPDNLKDGNGDSQPDVLEYEKLQSKNNNDSQKIELQRDKQMLEKEKLIADRQQNLNKLEIEKRKIEAGIEIENKKIQVSKILKGKDSKSKK